MRLPGVSDIDVGRLTQGRGQRAEGKGRAEGQGAKADMKGVKAPAAPGLSTFARLVFVLGGAVVFIVANVLMYLSQCSSTEFMMTCSGGNGEYTVHVIATAAILGIGAIISRRLRAFAMG